MIAYASRSVSKSESHYPAHKLEFLALKWAVCEKFHEYLYVLPGEALDRLIMVWVGILWRE